MQSSIFTVAEQSSVGTVARRRFRSGLGRWHVLPALLSILGIITSATSLSGCAPAEDELTDEEESAASARLLVTLYEDKNFGGRKLSLGEGFHNTDKLRSAGLQDKVSSIRVPAGWTVTLYEDQHGTLNGAESERVKISDNYRNLNDLKYRGYRWNDRVSSVLVSKDFVKQTAKSPIMMNLRGDISGGQKRAIANNRDLIKNLALVAYGLGYTYTAGTDAQVVGDGFEQAVPYEDGYEIKARYHPDDPGAKAPNAQNRLKIRLTNFRMKVDTGDLASQEWKQVGPVEPVGVEEAIAINSDLLRSPDGTPNPPSRVTLRFSRTATNTYTHTSSLSVGNEAGFSIQRNVSLPVLGGYNITASFKWSTNSTWTDATSTATSDLVGLDWAADVNPQAQRLVRLVANTAKYEINYRGKATIDFDVEFEGNLAKANGHRNHPDNEPKVVVKFTGENGGMAKIANEFNREHQPGDSQWDWDWVRTVGGNRLRDAIAVLRGGVQSEVNGKFSTVSAISASLIACRQVGLNERPTAQNCFVTMEADRGR